MTDETTTTKKATLSPIEVGAGAGAAVIAAVASSYLGTAGTLTGAAVASVVGTVSTSVLRSSAQTSAHRLKQTTTRLRDTRVDHAEPTDVRPVESEDVDPYGTQIFRAADWIDPEVRTGSDRGPSWATGADPGSTWEAPAQRLDGPGSDRGAGSAADRPYGPGTTVPGAPATPPGAEATGSWTGGTGPSTGAPWPGVAAPWTGTSGQATGAAGGSTHATPTRQGTVGPENGPGTPGAERSGDSDGRVRQGLRGIRGRWVVVGAGALASFALALGAITGIEAAAGKPLSGLAGRESGGGTTLGRVTGTDRGSDRGTPSPTPTPTTSGGATSTAPVPGTGPTVSPTAPSSSPSPAPSPSRQASTHAPTRAPTQAPSAPSQQTP